MKSILLLVLPLAILLSSASCKKNTPEIATGFLCKIDGKQWAPYSGDFKLREAECQIGNKGESVFITATNSKSLEHFAISVYSVGKIVTEGKYALNSDKFFFGNYRDSAISDFITGNSYEGEIEIIKIDKAKSRIIGKFYFNCYNQKLNQSHSITEGSFNLLYTSY